MEKLLIVATFRLAEVNAKNGGGSVRTHSKGGGKGGRYTFL